MSWLNELMKLLNELMKLLNELMKLLNELKKNDKGMKVWKKIINRYYVISVEMINL